jgi:hypothetical protein
MNICLIKYQMNRNISYLLSYFTITLFGQPTETTSFFIYFCTYENKKYVQFDKFLCPYGLTFINYTERRSYDCD